MRRRPAFKKRGRQKKASKGRTCTRPQRHLPWSSRDELWWPHANGGAATLLTFPPHLCHDARRAARCSSYSGILGTYRLFREGPAGTGRGICRMTDEVQHAATVGSSSNNRGAPVSRRSRTHVTAQRNGEKTNRGGAARAVVPWLLTEDVWQWLAAAGCARSRPSVCPIRGGLVPFTRTSLESVALTASSTWDTDRRSGTINIGVCHRKRKPEWNVNVGLSLCRASACRIVRRINNTGEQD